jgi:hypothetical protein
MDSTSHLYSNCNKKSEFRDNNNPVNAASPSRSAKEYSRFPSEQDAGANFETGKLQHAMSRSWRFSLIDDGRCNGLTASDGLNSSISPCSPFASSSDSFRSIADTEYCSASGNRSGSNECASGSASWTLKPDDHLQLARDPRFLRVLSGIGNAIERGLKRSKS